MESMHSSKDVFPSKCSWVCWMPIAFLAVPEIFLGKEIISSRRPSFTICSTLRFIRS